MIQTQRLILNPINWDDFEMYHRSTQDREVMRYITGAIIPTYKENKKKWIKRLKYMKDNPGLGVFSVRTKSDNRYIGTGNLNQLDKSEYIQIGYRLIQAAWRKGYATEISKALLKYGFDNLSLDLITAVVDKDNKASQHVIHKTGMQYKGIRHYYNVNLLYYEMTKEMYDQLQN